MQMSEKSGVLTIVLVVVHRVFYFHFIISFKNYDMVAKTFFYIIIILCFVNKLNVQCQILAGGWANQKKKKTFWGIQQVVDFLF
jgi:hypothetical protein